VPRAVRGVGAAQVRQQAVQHHQRALARGQRDVARPGPEGGPWRRVEYLRRDPIAADAPEPRLEPAAVRAGEGPHAAVVHRRVLEREPEAGHRRRLGVEEGAVLVAAHLAADVRRLEDVHRLDQPWIDEAEILGERRERGRARERGEGRVEVVQGVADLVQREGLGPAQRAGLVERARLEEEADLVARREEVRVGRERLVRGREDGGHPGGIERGDERPRAGDQGVARLGRDEVLDQQEAVARVARALLGREGAGHVRSFMPASAPAARLGIRS
jgi:hypothetical protein